MAAIGSVWVVQYPFHSKNPRSILHLPYQSPCFCFARDAERSTTFCVIIFGECGSLEDTVSYLVRVLVQELQVLIQGILPANSDVAGLWQELEPRREGQ